MPRWLEFALVVAVLAVLALTIAQSTTRIAEERIQLKEQIEALLKRDEVTLVDFVELLGNPDEMEIVTCDGAKCVKAVWDLSYGTVECWKRLVVVLKEETKRVFYSEFIDLIVIERTEEGAICREAPR